MCVILYLHAALRRRITQLTAPGEAERGDSPVPTAIIIAGLVAIAIAVLTWAFGVADQFMDLDTPDLPGRP